MKVFASQTDLKQFHYEIECIIRMFFPGEKVLFTAEKAAEESACVILSGTGAFCAVTLILEAFRGRLEEVTDDDPKDRERTLCRLLYRLLCQCTGKSLEWGTLTGVRPVKLVRMLREQGSSQEEIEKKLQKDYLVAPEKTRLCLEADLLQRPLLASVEPKDCSLYVSIPFCPSRCSYCSFVSHSVEKSRKLLPVYLEKLSQELALTGEILRERGLRLRTVYVGGGTPTVLDAVQLARLMEIIAGNFPVKDCDEFTVEAGRPDTITREKLEVLADAGVGRVSINPQTLNDEILASIGRRHSAEQFFQVYHTAKAYPFTVNVDLIAGLEGETLSSFQDSLDRVIALEPENITVHSLTLKRASSLYQEKSLQIKDSSPVRDMVNYSQNALSRQGYRPYYLYRQKNTIDSLENVGFARGDTLCAYNIFIMDESHTILSVGGGGVTKIVEGDRQIRRFFNYKYPYEYIDRFPHVLEQKEALRNLPFEHRF